MYTEEMDGMKKKRRRKEDKEKSESLINLLA